MATQTKPAGGDTAALAKIDDKTVCNVPQLRAVFDQALPQIKNALPATMKRNAERMARCAVTEFQRNEQLAKCTGLSILSCAIQAAQLGLEIGGPTGQCYMVPYGGKATFQIGYRGMITLAFRTGEVANIFAAVVREKDRFRMLRGTSPGIDHEPATGDAGKVIGVYAVLVYKTGQINYEYMSRDEVEHHRQRYSKQSGQNSPWASAWNEMAKKTAVRKLLKYAPLSVDFPNEITDPDDDTTQVTTPAVSAPALPANPEKCDGTHEMPRCAVEPGRCWHDAAPETDEDGNPIGALFGGDEGQVPLH